MRYWIAHDPFRCGDRTPKGALPTGSVVRLTLRVDPTAMDAVASARLEVLDGDDVIIIPLQRAGADAYASDSRGDDGSPVIGVSSESSVIRDAIGDGSAITSRTVHAEGGFAAEVSVGDVPRVIWYRFVVDADDGSFACQRRADGRSTAGEVVPLEAAGPLDGSTGFQLTVYDRSFHVPDWYGGTIVYQVFPDRFFRGKEGMLDGGIASHASRGWPMRIHDDWNEAPDWWDGYDPVDFFGGTLSGIEEKLDYLESLGVGAIYLNPICEARSNHRYDTGDYDAVDPILGDWEAFESLSEAARSRGIRLILDTVLSHTGAASKYFDLDGSYDSYGAADGPDSPYRSWYDFEHGTQYAPYRCWWNDPTLPEIEEHDPSWQSFMLDDGVLSRWMRHGAGGVRLDVADEIPDDVLEKVRAAVRSADPEAVVIGEVWEDPTTKESYGSRRTYALGSSLDSVMNYPLRSALISYALGTMDAQRLKTFLKEQRSNYPEPLYNGLLNLLSSHDVERIRSVLDLGREFRELPRGEQQELVASITDSMDEHGSRLQRLIACLQYMLPGAPCLYYGDERGMQGGRDPFDRATFPWGVDRPDTGRDLTGLYMALGKLRSCSEALRHGSVAFASQGEDVACVLRFAEGQDGTLACVVNRSDAPVGYALDLVDPSAGLSESEAIELRYGDVRPRCILTTDASGMLPATRLDWEDGILTGTIGPMEANIIQLDSGLQAPMPEGVGIIAHITSVPNGGESGTLGAPAKAFVDALASSGIRYWQILPLNPTDEHGSPYAGLSAFAGNTRLLEEGTELGLGVMWAPDYMEFVEREADWLAPYATFKALKELHGGAPWREWPEEHRSWDPSLYELPELADVIRRESIAQYQFDSQWRDLKGYANSKGIRIVGDMPMYVSADSADAWAHGKYLSLDEDGRILSEGGVPPDAFSEDGQTWGSPTYDWDALADDGYGWWLDRLGRAFDWYDHVRLDHFIGFQRYYSIREGETPKEGRWLPGPGYDLFDKAHQRFGPLPILIEDLGIITPEVQTLAARTGFTGMDVIQFSDSDPLIAWEPKPNKIAFTGTHDTPTLIGWVQERYGSGDSGKSVEEIADVLMDRVLGSDADIVFIPLQDVLGLGADARMNTPGTTDGNWEWQATEEQMRKLPHNLGSRIR